MRIEIAGLVNLDATDSSSDLVFCRAVRGADSFTSRFADFGLWYLQQICLGAGRL